MSTERLEAIQNTVEEILNEPPSPHTFFDKEPYDAAQAGEQVATASDYLRRATEIPKENLEKPTSRKFGISPNETHEAHIVQDAKNKSTGIVRQALTEQTPVAASADSGNQKFSKVSHETVSPRSDSRTAGINTFRPVASGNRISIGRWALRGVTGILLAASIGVAGVLWLGSSGDAAKTAPSQPAPPAQAARTAAASPEVIPLLQSMSRDLASVGKEIEQLKAGRELMVRENTSLREQLKASQEQLTRDVARLSEQLKASQEQVARDNANVAAQIGGIREQLTSVISRASEQNAPPKIAAAPPRPTPPLPRPAAAATPKPALSSAQAAAQPKPEKPKPSSTSRPPAPVRSSTP
jgi:regulator of replication initiation timing